MDGNLVYTGLFTTGLKLGVPYERLVTMRVPVLLMMIDSQYGGDGGGGAPNSGTRRATRADIAAFAAM